MDGEAGRIFFAIKKQKTRTRRVFLYPGGLPLEYVGLIPLANVDISVPSTLEVIAHDVAVVVVADIHGSVNFGEEIQGLTREVLLEMVRIDIEPVIPGFPGGFAIILDEINAATANGKHQDHMIPNLQRTSQPVLFEDRLDRGGERLFQFLRNVGHLRLPVEEDSML